MPTIPAVAVALYTFLFSIFRLIDVLFIFFHPGEQRRVSAVGRFIRTRGVLILLAFSIASACRRNRYGWLTFAAILT
ncbi:hypothetical protein EG829_26960, partial [bacterium]|nr:hypothetical protein [bacterium]